MIYVHVPSKYLIVSAPAAALLLARTASTSPRPAQYALGLSVLTGLLLGIAILRADAAVAEVSRVAAQKLVAPQIKSGRTVWYLGHWGFQWYAEKAGARCLNAKPPYPLIGDLIAYHANRSNPLNRQYLEDFILLDRIEDRRPGGRVMSKKAGAGFYSNDWGYLPWAWSDDVNDAVELWLVYPRQRPSDAPAELRGAH